MSQTAHFLVDPRLTALLGETYRSSEVALKELVDNAWDADARYVRITLPAPLSSEPVVVQDDGTGMTAGELRGEYLKIASDKRTRTGERTRALGRKVKGRKGIGKFAGLTLANEMTIETVARGKRASLTVSREELVSLELDLEAVPLRFEEQDAPDAPSGTTVYLRQLKTSLNFPTPDRLREVLIFEYGREDNFTVFVNGVQLSIDDIRGVSTSTETDLDCSGPVALSFTIAEGKAPRAPGIIVKVNGKSVGRPQFFGLDEDEEVPNKLLKRVYGEINIDGVEDQVTADWGALLENSKVTEAVTAFVAEKVKAGLRGAHASMMNMQKARLQLQINRRLAELPEHRREFARKALEQLLLRYYEESTERVEVIVEVALDAMEHDAYWAVLESIRAASDVDVHALSQSLNQFGLVELAAIAAQAARRGTFLDYLDKLIDDPSTTEQQVHKALETNLWVLGRTYALLASNVTLSTLVQKLCDDRQFASERPDLLLTEAHDGRYLLIELKRPSLAINRDHITQAEKYRDYLMPRLPLSRFDVLMIGKSLT